MASKRPKKGVSLEKETGRRKIYSFLLLCILFGVLLRFYDLGEAFVERDEAFYIVAAIKLNHDNPYDPRMFNYEMPPVAKWLIGFPTRFINADYSHTLGIPPQMYVYTYLVPYKQVYVPMRMVSAIFGAIGVLLIFLISKKVYNEKAALWSAAVAALSFDLVVISRITYLDSIAITLVLATIYFFIKYEETGKSKFALMTFFSLTLALGSRTLFPWIIASVLVVSRFVLNKDKKKLEENIMFVLGVLFSSYIVFYVLWPPEIRNVAREILGVPSLSSILSFTLHKTILSLLFRNSYFFVLALLLLIYEVSVKKFRPNNKPSVIVSIMLLFYILLFGITKFGGGLRYEVYLFIPLILLAGRGLENATKDRRIFPLIAFSIIINIFSLINWFPYFGEYSNFNAEEYKVLNLHGYYNHADELENAILFLEDLGSPPILTNEHNMLIFYPGESIPLIAAGEPRCNIDYISKLPSNIMYLYYGGYGGQNDLQSDIFVCQFLRSIPKKIIKKFGTQYGDERFIVKIYGHNVE